MPFMILRSPSREAMQSRIQELAKNELIAAVSEILQLNSPSAPSVTVNRYCEAIGILSRMLFRDELDLNQLPYPFQSVSFAQVERLSQLTLLAGVWVTAEQRYHPSTVVIVEDTVEFYMSIPVTLNDELKYEPVLPNYSRPNYERVEDITQSLESAVKEIARVADDFRMATQAAEVEPPIPIDPPATSPDDDPFKGL